MRGIRRRVACRLHGVLAGLVVVSALGACSKPAVRSAGWTTTRDTLPSGIVRVVNTPPGPGARPDERIVEELRIGRMEGGGPDQFGEIKGLAVLGDGRIAVLDALAKQVRIFGPDGKYLASFGHEGGGPGEFEAPYGLMLGPHGDLWVPDNRNDRMTVLDPDSGYVRSAPLHIYQYGYAWDGVILRDGRIVKTSHVLSDPYRSMLRVYGRDMEQVDSIIGPEPEERPTDSEKQTGYFFWKAPDGSRDMYLPVPFRPQPHSVLDPAGAVWSSAGDDPTYRIVRTSLSGDTSLIIETRRPAIPVSPKARDSAIAEVRDAFREEGGGLDQDWSRIPKTRPPIERLFVSEDGQLWVRTASPDSTVRFDVYDRDGTFRHGVTTALPLWTYIRPLVRGDRIWGVVKGSLGVEYVVRGRIRAIADGEGGGP